MLCGLKGIISQIVDEITLSLIERKESLMGSADEGGNKMPLNRETIGQT